MFVRPACADGRLRLAALTALFFLFFVWLLLIIFKTSFGSCHLDVSELHQRTICYQFWDDTINNFWVHCKKLVSKSTIINDFNGVIKELKLILFEFVSHQPLSSQISLDHLNSLLLQILILLNNVLSH